jgi:hypothetical protein
MSRWNRGGWRWLHRIRHWLGLNGCVLDGHESHDGHDWLMLLCTDCGERKRLAHSMTCECLAKESA